MTKELLNDIIGWDVSNWSKSLGFWNSKVDLKNKNFKCLEIGARQGGLSVWLALQGNQVVCSDISYFNQPNELKKAKELHKKHKCDDRITCEAINALDIPYKDAFDIVIMKSTLGGVNEFHKDSSHYTVIEQINKCLKPNGKVLFVENGKGSFLHSFARKIIHKNKGAWNYFSQKDLAESFSDFKKVEIESVGFLGVFGQSNKQRFILGRIDAMIKKIVPKSARYVIMGYVEK